MSVEVMSRVFADSKSKGAARLVLLALADEGSSTGEVTAYRRSQSWIGRKCNLDPRSVRRAIDDLVQLGELRVLAEGQGRQSSNYQITLTSPDTTSSLDRTPRPGSPDTTSSPSSRSSPTTPVNPCPPAADVTVEERFAKFWSMYPRKDARKAAESAFKSMVKRKHLDAARRALPLHITMWEEQKRPREKTPLAASWLNGERYLDELETDAHFAPPVPGKHRDAGKIMYRGDNTRFQVADDGAEIDLPDE